MRFQDKVMPGARHTRNASGGKYDIAEKATEDQDNSSTLSPVTASGPSNKKRRD